MKYIFALVLVLTLLTSGLVSRPAQAQGGGSYIVRQGDTLSSIAANYGTHPYELAAMNGLQENAWIYAGQQLFVPSAPSFTPGSFGGNYPQANPFFQMPPSNNFYQAPPPAYPGQQPFSGWTVPGEPVWVDFNSGQQTAPTYPWSPPPLYQPPAEPVYQPAAPASQIPGPRFQPPLHIPPVYPSHTIPGAERWIDVDLSTQTLVAYENQTPVFRARVSTGLPQYPTIAGTFQIYIKYEKADMSGGRGSDAYYLPDVPYVMYFHGDYGLHGTYWHSNFGTPMSHGCVNLSIADAKWLFEWAPLGARVVTHY